MGSLLEYRERTPAHPAQYVQRLDTTDERRLRQELIIALARSTAPLEDIVQFATTLLHSHGQVGLPKLEVYQPFRRRLVTIDALASVFGSDFLAPAMSNLVSLKPTHLPLEQDLYEPDVPHEAPKHWIPASPWTTITTSDDTVSELVSVALTWLNSFWRIIEEDLFLRALRSKAMNASEYCSPFLVHAVLAIGAVKLIIVPLLTFILIYCSSIARSTKRSVRPATSSLGASNFIRKHYVCGRWTAIVHASPTCRPFSS